MIISLDTECTGLDFAHGAKPFLVTTCESTGTVRFWEWDVDPLTREPQIPNEEYGDLQEIEDLIDAADIIYGQNIKFDARALHSIGIELPWHKVRDTLIMGHLLASNHGHRLDQMCIEYLGEDISKYEVHVKEIVQTCRALVRKEHPNWRIADEGVAGMPSVKASSDRDEDKPWKNDMWLPRALAPYHRDCPTTWMTACSRYANADSIHTVYLGLEMERLIRERGLWAIYEHRLHLPRVAYEMEAYGITAVGTYTETTIDDFEEYNAEAAAILHCIAAGYGHDLEMPKGAALNDNMRDFFYGAVKMECPRCGYTKRIKHWNGEESSNGTCPKCAKSTRKHAGMQHPLTVIHQENLCLPVIISKKTGNATLDKDAMQDYLATLDDGPALDFITLLLDKRGHDTALTYMHAYRRFWVPEPGVLGFYRIHPSLNPCATDHLRWASNSPNMQNVSGETKGDLSNRACFGPLPSREWWRFDFKSIERRIPSYESKEPKMVEVFDHPNKPPYWGNLYNLTASVLYPDEYWPLADTEGVFRKEYPRLYKGAKFFDLAKQYGCGRRKGDLLSGIKNSFDLVDNEFPLLAGLQAHYLSQAEKVGYVETIPDKTVDPLRGYPILPSRTDDGRVLSTTPFNYHVSGTACWIKNTALIRCADQCAKWCKEGFDAHLILEVHDELLFDFPWGSDIEGNKPRAMVLKALMEQGGEDLVIRIPTPVSVEYITTSWAGGIPC